MTYSQYLLDKFQIFLKGKHMHLLQGAMNLFYFLKIILND